MLYIYIQRTGRNESVDPINQSLMVSDVFLFVRLDEPIHGHAETIYSDIKYKYLKEPRFAFFYLVLLGVRVSFSRVPAFLIDVIMTRRS